MFGYEPHLWHLVARIRDRINRIYCTFEIKYTSLAISFLFRFFHGLVVNVNSFEALAEDRAQSTGHGT
jgi:hypothetical protein